MIPVADAGIVLAHRAGKHPLHVVLDVGIQRQGDALAVVRRLDRDRLERGIWTVHRGLLTRMAAEDRVQQVLEPGAVLAVAVDVGVAQELRCGG